MRWIFDQFADAEEAAVRRAVLLRVDRWWTEFGRKRDEISAIFNQQAQWDLPGWMDGTLQVVDPALKWEFGPAVKGEGHRLVITPEWRKDLAPLVQTILQRAPTLEGWEFYGYRLREALDDAEAAVEGRTGVSLQGATASASIGQWNRIDLKFAIPGVDESQAAEAAFIATEVLLGEKTLNEWIGAIVGEPAPKSLFGLRKKSAGPNFMALDRLPDMVDALIGSVQDGLPETPLSLSSREGQWSSLELHKPDPADEYPQWRDQFVAITPNALLWEAMHFDPGFASTRFSRCGEVFGCLKIDGENGLTGSRFADRAEIDDALHEALSAAKVGTTIGGGTGLRYSYIDLALTNLPKAAGVIRDVLQAGKLPHRTWIQFFDAELAAEWVGVYDDTPPPPLPDFESPEE